MLIVPCIMHLTPRKLQARKGASYKPRPDDKEWMIRRVGSLVMTPLVSSTQLVMSSNDKNNNNPASNGMHTIRRILSHT